jgi:chemotaxis protein CheC
MIDPNKTLDTLTEFINIGAGKAAQALNILFESHIGLQIPSVSFLNTIDFKDMSNSLKQKNNQIISMDFFGKVSGSAFVLFDLSKIIPLVQKVTGEIQDIDAISVQNSVLLEVSNILINSVVGSISNIVQAEVDYSVPQICTDEIISTTFDNRYNVVLKAVTRLTIEVFDFDALTLLVFKDNTFTDNFLSHFEKTIENK